MTKYKVALDFLESYIGVDNTVTTNNLVEEYVGILNKLIDKETPMKPKLEKLFGETVTICPADGCGVGLTKKETLWHKSDYCGRCGQRIDWED